MSRPPEQLLITYYFAQVAMKRFLDDVAVEAIEMVLMSALPSILSPVDIYKMEPDLVAHIAGEREEIQARRHQLVRKLGILSRGVKTCKQFAVNELSGMAQFQYRAIYRSLVTNPDTPSV